MNTGTVPGLPGAPRGQRGRPGWAHRRPTGQGWGGAVVVVAGVTLLIIVGGTWTASGWLGLTASLLLLAGDFGITGRRSRLLAALLAVGYISLIVWFGRLAALLLG